MHRSPHTLKRFIPPNAVSSAVLVAVILTFTFLSRAAHTAPPATNTSVFAPLARAAPTLVAFADRVRALVFWTTLTVHAGEATYMGAVVLRKHSVPVGSKVWWMWVVNNFFEGFPTFLRIGRWRRGEQEKKAAVQH